MFCKDEWRWLIAITYFSSFSILISCLTNNIIHYAFITVRLECLLILLVELIEDSCVDDEEDDFGDGGAIVWLNMDFPQCRSNMILPEITINSNLI